MRFKPKTDKEIAEENLWEKGEYPFVVEKGEDHYSKKTDADFIKLTVKVFNQEGKEKIITDYIGESMAYKLRHASYACGLGDRYETGELNSLEFEGRSGVAKVGIKVDKNGQYPDANSIVDYIVQENSDSAKPDAKVIARNMQAPLGHPAIDDEIPFD